ncbi:hypothetical protein, partial [Pyxidicoccus trucidator]|uniref:hypothetical protein n=1 Tax=Pyxidicoccus trucidator TaxID=2709662 RepID=UPI001968843C
LIHIGAAGCASQRDLAGTVKELTAVSAICLLLGLAIWFSKTESLELLATFCYRCCVCCLPFSTGGAAFSIRVRVRLQLLLSLSRGVLEVLSAAQWLPLFSFEGARLLPLGRLPCQPSLR